MDPKTLTRADLAAIVAAFDAYPNACSGESVLAADHYLGEEKARLLRPFRTLPDCERMARSALAYVELCAEQASEIERLRLEAMTSRLLYSTRAAMDRVGVPKGGEGKPEVSLGWQVRWLCEEVERLRAALPGDGPPPSVYGTVKS